MQFCDLIFLHFLPCYLFCDYASWKTGLYLVSTGVDFALILLTTTPFRNQIFSYYYAWSYFI